MDGSKLSSHFYEQNYTAMIWKFSGGQLYRSSLIEQWLSRKYFLFVNLNISNNKN